GQGSRRGRRHFYQADGRRGRAAQSIHPGERARRDRRRVAPELLKRYSDCHAGARRHRVLVFASPPIYLTGRLAMTFDFTGRRVVVAGGSRGIGRSIALAFAQSGAAVSVCAGGADGITRVREELAASGRPVHAATCDLGDAGAVARYIAEAAAALGGIDVLVNNASGFGLSNDEAGWAASVSVDLMA